MSTRNLLVPLVGAAVLLSARPHEAPEHGKLTVDEALELAFGEDALVEKSTIYLTEAELARAKELCGGEIASKIVRPHVAVREAKPLGAAYFETHEVRTKQETVMIVVDPKDRIARIEVLAFREPPEYLPRRKWYDQFTDHVLDDALSLKREIRGVTGATLTSVATTEAARRVLALHQVLAERRKREAEEAERARRKQDQEKRGK